MNYLQNMVIKKLYPFMMNDPINLPIKEFESCLSSNFLIRGFEIKVRRYHYKSVAVWYSETIR